MIDNKKINESRFKKQKAISTLTLLSVDFVRIQILIIQIELKIQKVDKMKVTEK